MRFINKTALCKPLQRRRNNPPQTDIDAKKAWRRFNKEAIRKTCYKQQFGLCAYTELALNDRELGNHLEHIAPRSRFPERTFEQTNIILASMDERFSGLLEINDRFGGHFKQAMYSDDWFIGPFDPRCELSFIYCDKTGLVLANDTAAKPEQLKITKTIDTLNLNCDYLVTMRLLQLTDLNVLLYAHMEQHASDLITQRVSVETLKKESLDVVGKSLPVFYTAKKQLFERFETEHFIKNRSPLTT